jgi:hypothetical protein
MKFNKSIAFRIAILLLSSLIMLKSYQRQRDSEGKRTILEVTAPEVTAKGNSLAEQDGYSNLAAEEISKLVEKHQMQNSTVGVWEGDNHSPYGTLFMFRLALNYFRVPHSDYIGAKWEQTRIIRDVSELAGIEYLVSSQALDPNLASGFHQIFDKGWLHLYQNKKGE